MIQTTENALIQKTKVKKNQVQQTKNSLKTTTLLLKDNQNRNYMMRQVKSLFCLIMVFLDLSFFEYFIKSYQDEGLIKFSKLCLFEVIFSCLYFFFIVFKKLYSHQRDKLLKKQTKIKSILIEFIFTFLICFPPLNTCIFKPDKIHIQIDQLIFAIRFFYHFFSLVQNQFFMQTFYIFQKETIIRRQKKQTLKKSVLYMLELRYLKTVMILFCLFLFIFTIILRQIETFNLILQNLQFDYFQTQLLTYNNCFWYVFITMTTIGYGDIIVSCFLGRLLVGFISISGQIFISFFIVALSQFFTIDQNEKIALKLIEQIERRNLQKIEACKSFQTVFRIKKNKNFLDTQSVNFFQSFFKRQNFFFQNIKLKFSSRSKYQNQIYQQRKNALQNSKMQQYVPSVLSKDYYVKQQQRQQIFQMLKQKLKNHLTQYKQIKQQYIFYKKSDQADDFVQALKKIEQNQLLIKKTLKKSQHQVRQSCK